MSRRKFADDNGPSKLKEDVQKVDRENHPRQIKKAIRQIQVEKEEEKRGSFKLTAELPKEKENLKDGALDIGSIFAAKIQDSKKSKIVFGGNKLQDGPITFKFKEDNQPRRSRRLESKAQKRISENPLCSRKSVTNFKESQEEEELKFVNLFQAKGNSKFKGKVEKFEEEVKQATGNFKLPEKKVVDLFAFGRVQSKIEPLTEIKKEEEKKSEIKPNSGGTFVFNPSVKVTFNFKAAAVEQKDEKNKPKKSIEPQEQDEKSDTTDENVEKVAEDLEDEGVVESHVQPIENSQSNSEKLFQKQIESMTSQIDAKPSPQPLQEKPLNEEAKDENIKIEKVLEHGYLSLETIENMNYLIFRSYTGSVLYKGYILKFEEKENMRLKARHLKSEDRKFEIKIQIFEINKDRKFEKQAWVIKMLTEADAIDFLQVFQSLLQ